MNDPILLDVCDVLTTERLVLRAPRAGDGVRVFEGVQETLAPLRRFPLSMPWAMGECSPSASEVWCRQAAARFILRSELNFLLFLRASDDFVGAMGCYPKDWATPAADIGFWCRSQQSGRGLMLEALTRMVRFAQEELGMVHLEIHTDEDNTRARKLATRGGFTLAASLHAHRRAPDGRLRSTCIYARATAPRDPASR